MTQSEIIVAILKLHISERTYSLAMDHPSQLKVIDFLGHLWARPKKACWTHGFQQHGAYESEIGRNDISIAPSPAMPDRWPRSV